MKRQMKSKIGKVIKEVCVLGVIIAVGANIVGCGNDTKKESKKATKTNMVTTTDSSEETTVNNENETITEEQEIDVSTDTATKESDNGTVAQQMVTTKKEETTKKVETTTLFHFSEYRLTRLCCQNLKSLHTHNGVSFAIQARAPHRNSITMGIYRSYPATDTTLSWQSYKI